MLRTWIDSARGWLLNRLGIHSHEARAGQWWEVDFLLIFMVAMGVFAIAVLLDH